MNTQGPTPTIIAVAPALFVVMWATGFVVARLSAPHVDPLTFLAIRFPIAGLIFAVIAFAAGASWPGRKPAVHAAIAGAFVHGGYLGPVYWAVAHGMPAGVSALIIGLQPLITALMASAMVQEEIGFRHWVGLAIGIAGIALVVSPKLTFAAIGGITPLTTFVNLMGAVFVAFGTVYQKKYATGLHLASGGAWQYVGATAVVLAGALVLEEFRFDGSFNAWFALGWSVIVLSLGAISLLMLLIRHGGVAKVSSLIFMVPAVSAAMAYVLFDETLTHVQVLGMAVCAGAVLVVTRKPARPS